MPLDFIAPSKQPVAAERGIDSPLRWAPDSRVVTYTDHRGGIDKCRGQPIDGGPARQFTSFKEGQIFSFDWSENGDLVASRGVITSDVVLISAATR